MILDLKLIFSYQTASRLDCFVPTHTTPNLNSSDPNSTTMSAPVDIATEPLSKVDSASAIEVGDASPKQSKISHRRTSSAVSGVFNINDLGKNEIVNGVM